MSVFLKGLGRAVDLAVIALGGGLIAIVLANVVLHLFGRDFAWVTELGEFLMVWVTFLGGVAAAQRNSHMAITELLDKLRPSARRWADCAVQLVCMAMLVLLFVFGLKIVDASWGSVLTTLDIPMAWQYMPLPLSALLMMIFHGDQLAAALRGRVTPHHVEPV